MNVLVAGAIPPPAQPQADGTKLIVWDLTGEPGEGSKSYALKLEHCEFTLRDARSSTVRWRSSATIGVNSGPVTADRHPSWQDVRPRKLVRP